MVARKDKSAMLKCLVTLSLILSAVSAIEGNEVTEAPGILNNLIEMD